MDLKNLLPAAAALIGISISACKPAQDKHREDVEHILQMAQPTEEIVAASQGYYNGREDLKHISDAERASLVHSHAKLKRIADGLKDATISFEDFYNMVVASDTRIVTDENTKLQTDFGAYYKGISVHPKSIEFWTTPGNPNIILEDYIVSNVEMNGGELRVSLSGNIYETVVDDDTAKQKIGANLNPRDGKHPGTKTLTLRLVLAK